MEVDRIQPVVLSYLQRRMSISPEQSGKLPPEIFALFATDTRSGLTQLFDALGRPLPSEKKLAVHIRAIREAVSAVSSQTKRREQPAIPISDIREITSAVPRQKEQAEEDKIETLIRRVEDSFDHFYGRMREGLKNRAAVDNPGHLFWTCMENPSHIISVNRTNPLRNAEVARRKAKKEGMYFPTFIHSKLLDARHFTYDIERGEAARMKGYAGFSPKERRIVLQETYDPKNAVDFLVAFHETVHVMHTAHWLMQGGKGFIEFYERSHPAVILNEEFDAYALEIEAMNLLLNDALRRSILSGKSPDVTEVAQQLQMVSYEGTPLPMLLNLSKLYFPSGTITQVQKPPAFMGQVAANQHWYGYDVFIRTEEEHLKQIQPPSGKG